MVGITVAEPIVPVYLDKAAMRKLKMKEGQGIEEILDKLSFLIKIKVHQNVLSYCSVKSPGLLSWDWNGPRKFL